MKTLKTCLLFLSASFFMAGCQEAPAASIQKTEFFMDTVVSVEVYGTKDEKILEKCFETGKEYEKMLSKTIPDSDVYKLNHNNGKAVTITDTTMELLKKGIAYGDLSEGSFDITIAAVSDLWNFKAESPAIPDDAAVHAAAAKVNYHNITISGRQAALNDPDAAVDLGGIAKGYIADKMKESLISSGVENAVLNLGGDVTTIGSKPDHSKWNIGIQKPFGEQNEVIFSVSVSDKAVVSSGTYERYFEKDGVIYHHLLDPATGYPYENGLTSITVIGENAADCDALSTTCFTLGLEKGLALINTLPDTEAVFITEDGQLHYSDGIGTDITVKEFTE